MRRRFLCALAIAGCGDARAPAGDDGIDPSVGVAGSEDDDGADTIWDFWSGPDEQCPAEPSGTLGRVAVADVPPPPVSGGTLVLGADGVHAFAADPDRDAIHIVDRVAARTVASIALPIGSEPGRVVEGNDGRVHAVLRGAGAVVTIDPRTGAIDATHEVCANPRGLAVDPGDGSLVVACAEGSIARVDARGGVAHVDVGVELRDVVDPGPPLRVSAYRTAEVLTVDEDGVILARAQPPIDGLDTPAGPEEGYQLNTARRTIATANGGWVMLHQAAFHERAEVEPGGYGGGHCLPLQTTVVSQRGPEQSTATSVPSSIIAPAFDLAISSAASFDDARWLAIVGSGAEGWALDIVPLDVVPTPWEGACDGGGLPPAGAMAAGADLPGAPTAVAFDAEGIAWVQLREPALLLAIDPVTLQRKAEIALSQRSVADSGHELFHRATASRIACASCHPEGREDGIAWRIEGERRRSQPLAVGLAGSEPFHWHGEMADITQIIDEVHGTRMCGERLGGAHTDALAQYLFDLRPLRPRAGDAESIARGAASFAAIGCAACHAGPRYTNDLTVQIDGKPLQVPTLRSVAFRPPFMHDARAPTLRAAIADMLRLSAPGGTLSEVETSDLVAFLESL